MKDERGRFERIIDKLGQRETWPQIAGITVSAIVSVGTLLGLTPPENLGDNAYTAMVVTIVATLMGTGTAAQVKRAGQRAQQTVKVLTPAVQDVRTAVEQVLTEGTTQGQVQPVGERAGPASAFTPRQPENVDDPNELKGD